MSLENPHRTEKLLLLACILIFHITLTQHSSENIHSAPVVTRFYLSLPDEIKWYRVYSNIYLFVFIRKHYHIKLFLPIIDKHVPVKKLTVRTVKAPWIDEEMKNCLFERVGGKRSG
jgi:hypothetical protein